LQTFTSLRIYAFSTAQQLPKILSSAIHEPIRIMRLLQYNNGSDFSLTEFFESDIPKYAILSHRWGPEEVTLADLKNGNGKKMADYGKIQFCGDQAKRDGLQYFWVNTCCIDKSNSTELAEAINSMFRWYQNATKCYVYLPDVSRPRTDSADKSNED
jgi:hypothetical protein